MKKLIFLLILFISPKIYSQDHSLYQKQIDSLEAVRAKYETRISELNSQIKQIEEKKALSKVEKFGGFEYIIPANSIMQIRDKATASGRLIFIPIRGEKITLIDFDTHISYWLVSFNKTEYGFVKDSDIMQNPMITDYKKRLLEIKSQIALKTD
jgi:hypothetical protein